MKPAKLPAHVKDWNDNRATGNPITVTLANRYCFKYPHSGIHSADFPTVTAARQGIHPSVTHQCACRTCRTTQGASS